MLLNVKTVVKYLPLVLGIGILSIGAVFVPWNDVLPYFSRLSWPTVVIVLMLGVLFYTSRALRYAYMLSVLGHKMPLRRVFAAYFVAQPVSLLPAGEAYRTVTLKRYGDVPLGKSIPIVFLQSFTENIGLVVLALIGAIILQQQVLLVVGVAVLYVIILLAIRARRVAKKGRSVLNKIPFVSLGKRKVMAFVGKNKQLLGGKDAVILLSSSFVSSFLAITALFLLARDLDISFSFIDAMIAFTLPTILQNLTALPGGLGVNEQSSVGIFLLLGVSVPAAVAVTLLLRFVTLVLGVILGLMTMLVLGIRGSVK